MENNNEEFVTIEFNPDDMNEFNEADQNHYGVNNSFGGGPAAGNAHQGFIPPVNNAPQFNQMNNNSSYNIQQPVSPANNMYQPPLNPVNAKSPVPAFALSIAGFIFAVFPIVGLAFPAVSLIFSINYKNWETKCRMKPNGLGIAALVISIIAIIIHSIAFMIFLSEI